MTDKYALLREKQTGGEFGPTTDELIAKLQEWDDKYGIEVSNVDACAVRVSFDKLPGDMQAFAEEICEVAVDVMAQHYDCFWELLDHYEDLEKAPQEYREMLKLAQALEMGDSETLMAKDFANKKYLDLFWD